MGEGNNEECSVEWGSRITGIPVELIRKLGEKIIINELPLLFHL